MKHFRICSAFAGLAAAAIVLVLFAFNARPGAHSVRVYIDDTLVVDRYVESNFDAPKLVLDPARNKELVVRYSECGRAVTGRKLTLRDAKGATLKELTFDGKTAGFDNPMSCRIKDLVALKSGDNSLSLFYSSNDFLEGQKIASLVFSTEGASASK